MVGFGVHRYLMPGCMLSVCPQSCIQRSFKAEVYSCPACRMELDDITPLHPNHNLMQVLGHFYPGYEVGRR